MLQAASTGRLQARVYFHHPSLLSTPSKIGHERGVRDGQLNLAFYTVPAMVARWGLHLQRHVDAPAELGPDASPGSPDRIPLRDRTSSPTGQLVVALLETPGLFHSHKPPYLA